MSKLKPTALIGLGGMLAGLGSLALLVFEYLPALIVCALGLWIGALGFLRATRGDED